MSEGSGQTALISAIMILVGVIPNPADQNPWAQSRRPIDMMVQG
jgi:hypothetical protein